MREKTYDIQVTMKLSSDCKKEEKYSWEVGYLDRESSFWIAEFGGFGESLSDAWSIAKEKRDEITSKKDIKSFESDIVKNI